MFILNNNNNKKLYLYISFITYISDTSASQWSMKAKHMTWNNTGDKNKMVAVKNNFKIKA